MTEKEIIDSKTMRKGLSKAEAALLSSLAEEGKKVIDLSEIRKKVGSPLKARLVASRLFKKKWLFRISRGKYLITPLEAGMVPHWTENEVVIASKFADPYYIGFSRALYYYSLTDQVPASVTIATTKPVKDRVINGVKYFFVSLNFRKFFGFEKAKSDGSLILYSDLEKTIVDCLDHPEYCGGILEVAKALNTYAHSDLRSVVTPHYLRRVTNTLKVYAHSDQGMPNWPKVLEYAKKMKNGAIFKRLGFFNDVLKLELSSEILSELEANLSKGYAPLSPGSTLKGTYDSKWRVHVNYSVEKIKSVML